MTTETDDFSTLRRKLIVHDVFTFLSLSLVTAVLFLATLLLFHSFAKHRNELATRWSTRGRVALNAGRPDEAIVALRTALSYAPGQRSYELLLAQALGDAGHTEEAYNYFLGLWETQPGDGFINLRLARLAAKMKDRATAINFYRASIYGTWEGDGAVRRRDVRLELACYLIEQHDTNSARTELLIAGGNNQDDPGFALILGDLLQQAGDPADALRFYKRVLVKQPQNQRALESAGRMEYEAGNYEETYRLLERAIHEHKVAEAGRGNPSPETMKMLAEAGRLVMLQPAKKLSAGERVSRILTARAIAKRRFDSCSAQLADAEHGGSVIEGLKAAWSSQEAAMGRAALLRNADAQDGTVKLIFDTEVLASQVCGSPTGDDALLLRLAQASRATTE